MQKVLTLVILFATADIAFACRCMSVTFEKEAQSSEAIFHGRVVAVDDDTFEIAVMHVWKGEFPGNVFQLVQGETSCERRTFELNQEYVFYLEGTSVFNCSRTSEYSGSLDPELLDLKFHNLGDKDSIESDRLTGREIDILKSLLTSRGIDISNVDRKVLFAIQYSWVNKWTFFEALKWSEVQIEIARLGKDNTSGPFIVWAGNRWDKSIRRLRRNGPKG